jgi:hypothetical protein
VNFRQIITVYCENHRRHLNSICEQSADLLTSKQVVIIPCGLLVDNNKFLNMYIFKRLTGCTDDGGYENRNAYLVIIIIIIIIKTKEMNCLFWIF